jgi:hypothetical protein
MQPTSANLKWIKSSFSYSNGNCTEVALSLSGVLVRDSRDPDGPRLLFAPGEWRAFVRAVKAA